MVHWTGGVYLLFQDSQDLILIVEIPTFGFCDVGQDHLIHDKWPDCAQWDRFQIVLFPMYIQNRNMPAISLVPRTIQCVVGPTFRWIRLLRGTLPQMNPVVKSCTASQGPLLDPLGSRVHDPTPPNLRYYRTCPRVPTVEDHEAPWKISQ